MSGLVASAPVPASILSSKLFYDRAVINVRSGDGGNGHMSFRREKNIPTGGPDGGDGGKGGSVILRADRSKNSLLDFRFRHKFFAQNGDDGQKDNKTGKSAADLVIAVPPGTLVISEATNELLADLLAEGDEIIVAEGGRGGLGNARFKNSIRQTPRFATSGKTGQELLLRLELKLIADVALIGYPNAGKSTLLSMISAAKPKIADYPFTTLEPVLGVVSKGDFRFVVADIPGLIEGAAEGAGMGHDFLRHVERTKIFLHLLDASGQEGRDPFTDFTVINQELQKYKDLLAQRPQWVILNKIDITPAEKITELQEKITKAGFKTYAISAATRAGVDQLVNDLAAEVAKLPDSSPYDAEELRKKYVYEPEDKFTIVSQGGMLSVKGAWIRELLQSTNFDDYESRRHFQRQIERFGLEKTLRAAGMKDGDTVLLAGSEFEFEEEL